MWTGRWETRTAAIFPRIWLPWPGGIFHKSHSDKFALFFYYKAILNSNTFPFCISHFCFHVGSLVYLPLLYIDSFIQWWSILENLPSYWQMLMTCIASGFFLFITTPTNLRQWLRPQFYPPELKGKVEAFTETNMGPVFWLVVTAQ